LMSTVASLPFFLFTLPAGALADRVDRLQSVQWLLEEPSRAQLGGLIFR
jgi:hypothetical protein